jgi:hypothetical protein
MYIAKENTILCQTFTNAMQRSRKHCMATPPSKNRTGRQYKHCTIFYRYLALCKITWVTRPHILVRSCDCHYLAFYSVCFRKCPLWGILQCLFLQTSATFVFKNGCYAAFYNTRLRKGGLIKWATDCSAGSYHFRTSVNIFDQI